MKDETTPQDSAAMSPASDGSVDKPVAWATLFCGSPLVVSRFKQICDDEAHYQGDVATVIPLYRSPTLTAVEREAIEAAIDRFRDWVNGTDDDEREATLCGLLERTK